MATLSPAPTGKRHLLIHIHGFLCSPAAARVDALRQYIEENQLDVEVISPPLPDSPQAAITLIEHIIATETPDRHSIALIGHSLGGYFATYLAIKHGLKAVLVNPVVRGYDIMCEFFGEGYNPHTNTTFIIGEHDIGYLASLYVETIPTPGRFMVMLQRGDEIVNPNDALAYYQGSRFLVEENGCHDFSQFEKHAKAVLDFLFGG